MSKDPPYWLPQIKEFCHSRKITIMGWGPKALVLEAKSPERREDLSKLFKQMGFEAVPDKDDEYAGMLTLARNDGA